MNRQITVLTTEPSANTQHVLKLLSCSCSKVYILQLHCKHSTNIRFQERFNVKIKK